jgi:hypothetical protein
MEVNLYIIHSSLVATVSWDENKATLKIKSSRYEAAIKRSDLQVISSVIWDIGVIVSSKGEYTLGRTKLASKTIFFCGFDDDKLSDLYGFLELCKRFNRPTKAG